MDVLNIKFVDVCPVKPRGVFYWCIVSDNINLIRMNSIGTVGAPWGRPMFSSGRQLAGDDDD